MMKWKSWLAISALSLGLIGCAPAANQAQDTAYHGAGTNGFRNMAYDDRANLGMIRNTHEYGNPHTYANNSIYKDGNMGTLAARTPSRHYGWATYSKRDMNVLQADTFHVDRNVLARAVGTVVTSVPGVETSSVLVTDEEIFVGVPGVTDTATLNKVKLSAWSISPRYYKVYVTGDHKVINQVKSLVNGANTRQGLDQGRLNAILQSPNLLDMTGTNVTDNKQNVTDYNLNQKFPNTNGTHRTTNR